MRPAASTTAPVLKGSQDVQESGPWYDTPGYLQGGYVGIGEFGRIEVQLNQAGVHFAFAIHCSDQGITDRYAKDPARPFSVKTGWPNHFFDKNKVFNADRQFFQSCKSDCQRILRV